MSNVVFLDRYRKTGDGRSPLYVSHLDGKIQGYARRTPESSETRLIRIRSSLERINRLMTELRKKSDDKS